MFNEYFDVFLADNDEGRDINYQIRYRVYCIETGYELSANYPDEKERDQFDAFSAHFILGARSTKHWIAALRLVVSPWNKLPLNKFAQINQRLLLQVMKSNSIDDFALSGEISRMCVVSQYRRRPLERNTPYQIPWNADEERSIESKTTMDERRRAPWLMLALLYAARDYSVQNGINHWFFLAAPSLARIFKGLGMELEKTGPECEHRGIRFPHVIKIPSGYDKFELKYPKLAQTIPQGIRYQRFSELKQNIYTLPPVNMSGTERGQSAEI